MIFESFSFMDISFTQTRARTTCQTTRARLPPVKPHARALLKKFKFFFHCLSIFIDFSPSQKTAAVVHPVHTIGDRFEQKETRLPERNREERSF